MSYCPTCGSLIEACGDVVACKAAAKTHIDKYIQNGRATSYGDSEATDLAYLTEVAHQMLGETILSFRES